MNIQEILSKAGSSCNTCNSNADEQAEILINKFVKLGAIPHCYFPELAKSTFIFCASSKSLNGQLDAFTSFEAFNAKSETDGPPTRIPLKRISPFFGELNISNLVFHSNSGSTLKISNSELLKLIMVSNNIGEKEMYDFEEIELNEGEEVIFSTPEPELPPDFINYLSETLSRIIEIEEAFVFDTTLPDENVSSLVIGVVFKEGADAEKYDNLAYTLIEGIQQFIEDREVIDFMVLDDEELIKIARSVSPKILLLNNKY